MTPEQESHLERIKAAFTIKVDAKYRQGQAEHGGDLFTKAPLELIDLAIEEAIDQVVYLETMRERILAHAAAIEAMRASVLGPA